MPSWGSSRAEGKCRKQAWKAPATKDVAATGNASSDKLKADLTLLITFMLRFKLVLAKIFTLDFDRFFFPSMFMPIVQTMDIFETNFDGCFVKRCQSCVGISFRPTVVGLWLVHVKKSELFLEALLLGNLNFSRYLSSWHDVAFSRVSKTYLGK